MCALLAPILNAPLTASTEMETPLNPQPHEGQLFTCQTHLLAKSITWVQNHLAEHCTPTLSQLKGWKMEKCAILEFSYKVTKL